MIAPSRYWVADKNGTAVKKFDTAGETEVNLPNDISAVAGDSLEDLNSIEVDTSILTKAEKRKLGIIQT